MWVLSYHPFSYQRPSMPRYYQIDDKDTENTVEAKGMVAWQVLGLLDFLATDATDKHLLTYLYQVRCYLERENENGNANRG